MNPFFLNFEKKYDIIIPSDYKCLETYLGLSTLIYEYYDQKEDYFFRVTKWLEYSNEFVKEVKIDTFFKIQELNSIWERHIELWGKPIQYLPIGSTLKPANGLILIGIDNDISGQIWYSKEGTRNPEYLEIGICALIDKLNIIVNESKRDVYNKMYKNINEYFWRVH